jgi:molybdopterin molybdotransferase
MISVDQAEKLLRGNVPAVRSGSLPLCDSAGSVLAEDFRAPVDWPHFDNSAMDGFALRFRDSLAASAENPARLKIQGSLRAGDTRPRELKRGHAFRIMTGAKMPAGADSVLALENASETGGFLILRGPVRPGAHVRKAGEDIKKGKKILRKYAVIHPGTVGLLASLGVSKLRVFLKPRVSVLTTGDELVRPGRAIKPGQIYDSNRWMLSVALKAAGYPSFFQKRIADRPAALNKAVRNALQRSEVLILTGGVSAGDYDFVKRILSSLGVRTVFWKVNQKPGKPLYFGKAGSRLVFGLPGNPGAVFTCFYEYVIPALRRMAGFRDAGPVGKTFGPGRGFAFAAQDRFLFLRARYAWMNGGARVKVLPHQGSHMMSSLSETNAFVRVPPRAGGKRKQFRVDLIPCCGGLNR